MKRLISICLASALTAIMAAGAFAQQPTREQMEAMIAQMPKVPNTDQMTVGKLDNGLTYYIRKNALPEHRAEFYLATNVGAIQEEYPSQDGLAHFLEHMCFNGTENFPDKTILNYLRSIGAEFGRNINASTGFEETQYMLNNIPVERESVVDSCLMILRDYSHYVINDPVEIDKERGVIIEERRQRRNAQWRYMERSLPYYFGEGTPMAEHTLIGTQEHLETFAPESLVSFYRTWYNPCNQAVVVVGDVDVERTAERIRDIFGVIPAKEDQQPKAILALEDHAEPRVGILTDPEDSSPGISLLWHSAAMPESFNETVYYQMTDLLQDIVSMVVYERMTDITSKPGSAFLGGSLGFSSLIYEDIDAVEAEVQLREENIIGGFEAFYTELVRLKRYGITDAEFGRVKAEILSRAEARANKADTRRNPEFVRPILSSFFDRKPVMEPKDRYELYQGILSQINASAVHQVCAQLLGTDNLVVLYTGPEKEGIATPSADDLLAAMAKVDASDIEAPEGEDIPEALLNPAKLKGGKVKKQSTTIYGASEWILSNGVKVVAYPTDLTKDQIIFGLTKQGGLSLVPTEDMASFDRSIFGMFLQNSGVSTFSGTTLEKMLTGKNVSVNPYFNNLEHGINGSSTVKDLETALQLLYLYYTQPRFDAEEWANGEDQLRSYLPNVVNQPSYKFSAAINRVLFGNNPRTETLSMEKLDKASLAAVERNWKKLFKDAAGATFVIVGDFNPEAVKPLVEKYIGSLPKGKKALEWIDTGEDIVPGHIEETINVDMQTPKSSVLHVYTAPAGYSAEKDAALDAVSYILNMRYTESLREEEGGTYGAHSSVSLSRRPKEEAFIQVYFDCKPALCDRLNTLAQEGINALAQDGPTDEEVSMAKQNLQKKLPESRQSNGYWKNRIDNFLVYGTDSDAEREAAVNALDKTAIQNAVKEVLESGNFINLVMKPANAAEAE